MIIEQASVCKATVNILYTQVDGKIKSNPIPFRTYTQGHKLDNISSKAAFLQSTNMVVRKITLKDWTTRSGP